MDKLNFYTVDPDYVRHLKDSETEKRGFSRVPNMEYGEKYKPKFLCGVVLEVNGFDYYVPVSSFKMQKPDNFLIVAKNGSTVSSLRFNYMFPIPKDLITPLSINAEPDLKYRALLSQELRYCIKNQEQILALATRTYKRVMLGKDLGLVANSCDFALLEDKCQQYHKEKDVSCEKSSPTGFQSSSIGHDNSQPDNPILQYCTSVYGQSMDDQLILDSDKSNRDR